MTIDELRDEMRDEFATVRKESTNGFAAVRRETAEEFAAVRKETSAEFAAVRSDIAGLRSEVKAESEQTRRHIDIAVEHFHDYVKMLADGTAHNTQRLDNHESRITTLERRDRSQ